MLTQQAELLIEFRIGGRQHSSIAGRNDLARMEGETCNRAMGPANPLPALADFDLAPDRARRVLNDRQSTPLGDGHDRGHVAGQPDLVYRHDRLRTWRDR